MTGRRITVVTAQLRGYDRVGGAGTATTFLALALARLGHDVDVLYVGPAQATAVEGEWARLYADAGVRVRRPPTAETRVEPPRYARMRSVERALRNEPTDVVLTHDFGAPAHCALRLRRFGLAFEDVLFVTLCHGTRRWVKEVNRNARVSPHVLGENLLERTAVELSDVVVSPSAYMLEWMRADGWQLPEATFVVPYVTRSAALGEPLAAHVDNDARGAVERLAFFGRLDERKGLAPFLGGLDALPRELLERVEVEFIGKPTKEWSAERVAASISQRTKRALRGVSFEPDLDQHEALARLSRPGTLAVIPSLADNSPNTVYECIERGIPFIASGVGGTGELVAAEDRARVLFEPTSEGVRGALERALTGGEPLRAARPAFDGPTSLRAWSDVIAMQPAPSAPVDGSLAVAVRRRSDDDLPDAPWVLLLDDGDEPDPALVETLARAQAASGADVVTCGVSDGVTEYFFAGDPGGLGVLTNDYGTVALLRRELLTDVADHEWPLLARLSAAGARIESVPLPLVRRTHPPGTLAHEPSDALLVVEHIERALPGPLRSLARLAAGLAADAARAADAS